MSVGDERADGEAPVESDRHDLAPDLSASPGSMCSRHAYDLPTARGEDEVCKAIGSGSCRLGRERPGLLSQGGDEIETLVGPVDEDQPAAPNGRPCATAVLVHLRARVRSRRQEVLTPAVFRQAHDDVPAALARAPFDPVDRAALAQGDLAETHSATCDVAPGYGGVPSTEASSDHGAREYRRGQPTSSSTTHSQRSCSSSGRKGHQGENRLRFGL